jgi:general secretion pathway protein I
MARPDATRGFTLLEVLVAVAVLGLALVSLLGLHVRNIDLIARDQRITEATMLARGLMAEIDADPKLPDLGTTEGDFEDQYPGLYPGVRWEREVSTFELPTIREVRVRVFRGDEESGDDVTLTYYVVQH